MGAIMSELEPDAIYLPIIKQRDDNCSWWCRLLKRHVKSMIRVRNKVTGFTVKRKGEDK